MSTNKRKATQQNQRSLRWLLPVLAGAFLLSVGAFLAWRSSGQPAASTANGTPRLTADKEKVDLGDVPLGQTVTVAFELTNTGDAPLRFKEAPYVEVVEGC